MLILPIHSLDIAGDESKWAELFEKTWPTYKRWFTKEGLQARPGYLSSSRAFEQYFQELTPTYEKLCQLIGGSDLASRFLSMYCPPPYMSGCSQIAWIKDHPALIRNYDYSPRYFEGAIVKTNWLKPIIGMSDCTWGLLDGVNEDGLSASLTFGGRKLTAEGFGIPLVLRYCLETCSTTVEAIQKLANIPVHMAYNVTLLDRYLNFATIYFIPGQKNQVNYIAVGTNHQEEISWPDYARMTRTVERRNILENTLLNPMETHHSIINRFLAPPLFNTAYEKAFGTLYTAAYYPIDRSVRFIWQGKEIYQSFEHFEEGKSSILLKTNAKRKLAM
ncbi:MAG: C45 family peptidase [Salibacteraceae bacterium]